MVEVELLFFFFVVVVVVRRFSDGNVMWWFKEFENEVENIGRVSYFNIVRLRVYYYVEDEKLFIIDYISNGSLYFVLYGKNINFKFNIKYLFIYY